MYTYKSKVLKVVDGDTVDLLIDLGFNAWKKERIRLYGINTPESRTRDLEEKKLGLQAKARLKEIIENNEEKIYLKSHGVGKYGRCLGELFYSLVVDEEWGEVVKESINKQLIKEGHAVEYFGGKR